MVIWDPDSCDGFEMDSSMMVLLDNIHSCSLFAEF